MNLWNAADKLSELALPILAALLLIVAVVYFFRGKVVIWFLRRGLGAAEQIAYEILGIAGIEEPTWALVRYPERGHNVLGLVLEKAENRAAVLIPSVPKLVPANLVFVNSRYITLLPNLSFRGGLEVLVTLGSASESDVIREILLTVED